VTYTIKRIGKNDLDFTLIDFLYGAAVALDRKFNHGYRWGEIDFESFVENHLFLVCFRNKRPVGFLAASFTRSFFDPKCVILRQNLLYSLPNTRASLLLLKEFVDFGTANANHIITTIGPKTNIKSKSLEKLGFNKLEELYRMET
jgi:hypothetical protein